jgi:hypothetical protein
MFSAQTTAHDRTGQNSAAVALTRACPTVRSRWQSARDQIRNQFAADQTAPGRRGLQLCLGLIWLLDAALQYQPVMFRSSFATMIIEPAAAGNPRFVTGRVGQPPDAAPGCRL